MPRSSSITSFACAFLFLAAARPARAEEPRRPVLAVDVSPGEPELDPSSVRAAIGAELGDEAVAPSDLRAREAVGTLRVSVDRGEHTLVVAYQGACAPITRKIDLPRDPVATEHAAVMLAGNLARDEAGELAESLREHAAQEAKERRKEPPSPPASSPSSVSAPPASAPRVVPAESAPSTRSSTVDVDVLVYNASHSAVGAVGTNGLPVSIPINQSYDSIVLGIREERPHFRLDIEMPFATDGVDMAGNIAFGFYYRDTLGTLNLDIGAILELPTAPADSSYYANGSVGVTALVSPAPTELLAAHGGDRAWLWFPHYIVPVAPSARLAWGGAERFSEVTELTIAPMIATDAGVRNVLVPVVQLSEEIAAHVSVLRGGVRAEVVGAFANVGSAGYLSLMPFVGVAGRYGFLDVGTLFDLVSAPAPTAGGGAPNWGLRVRAGVHF